MNDSNTIFLNSVTDNSYILPLTKENVADFEENYHSKNVIIRMHIFISLFYLL